MNSLIIRIKIKKQKFFYLKKFLSFKYLLRVEVNSLKKIAGSILAGLSLIAEVVNEWLQHFFWAVANIGKGVNLSGGGSFQTPAEYAEVLSYPYDTLNIFILTRILLWIFIGFGILLIGWGLWEDRKNK